MSKSEKIFPLSTTGGRLQHLCQQKGISRNELYHALLGEKATSNAENSISRTVLNWYSEETKLDFGQIRKACTLLECSADYLLCLDECTNKTTQFIQDATGLSEKAINCLEEWKKGTELTFNSYDGKNKAIKESSMRFLNIVNMLFEEHEEYNSSLGCMENHQHVYLLNCIHKFLYSHFTEMSAYDGEGESTGKLKDWKYIISKDSDELSDMFDISGIEKQVALNKITQELEELYSWIHSQKNIDIHRQSTAIHHV